MSLPPGTVASVSVANVTSVAPPVQTRSGRTSRQNALPLRCLLATFTFSVATQEFQAQPLSYLTPPPSSKKRKFNAIDNNDAARSTRTVRKKSVAEAKESIKEPDPRPLPWGEPQVWAETRADLSGSLPYFQAYQGSTYTGNGIVKGMLIDYDNGERQYMDEEVVIARAGGGIGNDNTGEKTQIKDQDSKGNRVQSFRHNMERGIPFMLIVGVENLHCPSQMPHRYCVLGAFHVTDMWAERTNKHVVWRFRMEKVDLKNKSWWAPETSLLVSETRIIAQIKALQEQCGKCGQISKKVYVQGWMCFNQDCENHWKLDGKEPPKVLEFDNLFKGERTALNGLLPPFSTIPKLPEATGLQTVAKQCWKGIVCPKCGRCNQRIDWDAWRCQTDCWSFKLELPAEIISASAVLGDLTHEYQGHTISEDWFHEHQVQYNKVTHGFYVIHDYTLPHGILVSHGHSNSVINSQPGAADDAFRGLQEAKIGLQRLPLQTLTSGSRSAHFSRNFGLPYAYVIEQADTTGFKVAPQEVKEAIRRMTWAAKRAVSKDSATGNTISDDKGVVFNECLAVGYFQGGKMGYHDDGKKTLGPHIAAWSLGCPAWMNVRMKFKYFSGFNRDRTNYDPSLPIIPGCYAPEVRRELQSLAPKMSRQEVSKLAKERLKKCPSHAPLLIKMRLRHGDWISMHGAEMQLYYEHEVVPTNELRFGLTCRYIKPQDIAPELHSQGDLPEDLIMDYDGDMKTFHDWEA